MLSLRWDLDPTRLIGLLFAAFEIGGLPLFFFVAGAWSSWVSSIVGSVISLGLSCCIGDWAVSRIAAWWVWFAVEMMLAVVVSIKPTDSHWFTLCLLAALSVGSLQLIYCIVTSLSSPIISSVVGIGGGVSKLSLVTSRSRGGLLIREDFESSWWLLLVIGF